MKYLLTGLTFIAVFTFFIGLALGLTYAGSGSIDFGSELQGALCVGVLFGLVLGGFFTSVFLQEVAVK